MGPVIIDLRNAFLTDEAKLVQVLSMSATELLCEDASTGAMQTLRVEDVGIRWRRVIPEPPEPPEPS